MLPAVVKSTSWLRKL